MSAPTGTGPVAAPHWSIVQHTRRAGGAVRLGILDAGGVHAAPPELADLPTTALLADWARWEPLLRDLDPAGLPVVDDAVLAAPITYPRKVLCAGANYYSHAAEMGTDRPDPAAEPFFFLKAPTTTVVGDGARVRLPAGPDSTVDWEAELGVVIASTCSDLAEHEARAHVAGYVLANDLSDRGRAQRPSAVFPAFAWDWLAHKSRDGFCPLGPGIVPVWAVPDPQDLRIRLWVGDELKQDASTSDMVVGVDGLVAAASRMVTLEPGDVVLTGTPAGVGMPRGQFLAPGDVVRVEADLLGRLTTTMVSPGGHRTADDTADLEESGR